jgi:MFS family permease
MAMGAGFVLIAAIATPVGLYAGTVILAFGNSLIFPALLAMALDGARPEERAPIVSTFTASLDIATGLGGLSLGAVAAVSGYRGSFVGGAVFDGLALVLLRSRALRGSRERTVAPTDSGSSAISITGRGMKDES